MDLLYETKNIAVSCEKRHANMHRQASTILLVLVATLNAILPACRGGHMNCVGTAKLLGQLDKMVEGGL